MGTFTGYACKLSADSHSAAYSFVFLDEEVQRSGVVEFEIVGPDGGFNLVVIRVMAGEGEPVPDVDKNRYLRAAAFVGRRLLSIVRTASVDGLFLPEEFSVSM